MDFKEKTEFFAQSMGYEAEYFLPEDMIKNPALVNFIESAYLRNEHESDLFKWFVFDLKFTRKMLIKIPEIKNTDYLFFTGEQISLAEVGQHFDKSWLISVWAARKFLPEEKQRALELALKRKYQKLSLA